MPRREGCDAFQRAEMVQVEGSAEEHGVAVVVEHRQQPARLVGRQAIVLQGTVQVELGVSRIVEGLAIEVLVVGAVGQGVVLGRFGTMDGQEEELVDLHGHDAVVLPTAERKADTPEAAQIVCVAGCSSEALLFIITVYAQATAVIRHGLAVLILVVRLACEGPCFGIRREAGGCVGAEQVPSFLVHQGPQQVVEHPRAFRQPRRVDLLQQPFRAVRIREYNVLCRP